jgi:hypothetical protein
MDFNEMIDELAKILNIKLSPDPNGTCLIRFPNGLNMQIERQKGSNDVFLVIELGNLSVGRYREDVLVAALKANGAPYPRVGVFAFSPTIDNLILFERIPENFISGLKVFEIMMPLAYKGKLWKDQMERGSIPTTEEQKLPTEKTQRGMFGLA